jgi:hypothetical protein
MATVRELIAKFGFDIDTKPVEEFNKQFGKTKQLIGTFAVGKLLSAFSAVGQEMDVIRRNIGLFANEIDALKIVDGMDRIVSSTVDASRAVQQSLEELGDIGFTRKTMQDVEDFAALTGKSVEEVRALIDQAASGQNLAPLKALGLTVQKELEALNRQGIAYTTATIKQEILNRLEATRLERQKKVSKAFKDLDVQQSRSLKIFEDFGQIVGEFINPILSTLLEIFNDLAAFFLNNRLGQFIGKLVGLGGLLTVVLSGVKLLGFAFKLLGIAISPVLGFIGAIGTALGAAAVFVHDLWAALNDPSAAIWFGESNHFKRWVRDLKELGEIFDIVKNKIADFYAGLNVGQKVRNLFLSEATLKLQRDIAGGGNGGGGGAESKTATITIHADTVEAGQAAGQEVGKQLKQAGFTSQETTFKQLKARRATQAGG